MNAVEKLKILLDSKAKDLAAREEQLAKLTASTRDLRAQIEGIQESIRALQADQGGFAGGDIMAVLTPKVARLPIGNIQPERRYAGVGLTVAVLDVIETGGTAPGLTATEIVEKLLGGGFTSDAKDFYPSVYAVAMRLIKQGKIKEGRKNGTRTFMKKEPF